MALSMTHYTSDFAVRDTSGVSRRTSLQSLVLFIAPDHLQGFRGVPIFWIKRERLA
jgi:hypothetical protein